MDIDELYAMAGVKPDDVDFVQTYDDYPVICMMQIEDLGFCAKGEGPDFVRSHTLHRRRHVSAQHLGRPALGRPGRRGRRLSRPGRSAAPAHRHDARHRCRRQDRPGLGLRHDHLRPRPVRAAPPCWRGPHDRAADPSEAQGSAQADAGAAATAGVRSRTALGLTAAAARGPLRAAGLRRVRRGIYPPRDACPHCLSARAAVPRRRQSRHAAGRDHHPHLDRPLFSRAHAVARRHGAARCRPVVRGAPARRRARGRAGAAGIQTRQGRARP